MFIHVTILQLNCIKHFTKIKRICQMIDSIFFNEELNMFTAKIVKKLCGVSDRQLTYWSELGLVTSNKLVREHGGRPLRVYSWEHLLELKVIARLRESVGLPIIRKAIEYLSKNSENPCLREKILISMNGEILWINRSEMNKTFIEIITGKFAGQSLVVEFITSANTEISELWQAWENDKGLCPEFPLLAKLKPLEEKEIELKKVA
jgi:DNA-binding transcriptional MerR regulator